MAAPRSDEVRAQLFAHVRDVNIQQVGKRAVVLVEQVFVKHRARDDFTAMQREKFHERIFARGEIHRFAGEQNVPRRCVNLHAANLKDVRCLVRAAADEGAQAGEQFVEIERLDHVIIRAGVETFDAVARLVARGEHENGSCFDFAEALENFPAVELGQHHIQDDGVVVVALGFVETVLAVGGGVHGVAFLAQRLRDAAKQVRFVFHDQDSHSGWRSFNTDAVRYYFLRFGPLTGDIDISLEKLTEVYNSDLANGLGNLIARIGRLGEKAAFVPAGLKHELYPEVKEHLDNFRVDLALEHIWKKIKECDQAIDTGKPWQLPGTQLRAFLATIVPEIQNLAYNLTPFLPESAKKIEDQFSKRIYYQDPLFPRSI